MRFFVWIAGTLLGMAVAAGQGNLPDWEKPEHGYWEKELRDPFSLLKEELEGEKLSLDRSGETAFLRDLLNILKIPETSQALLFSTTSLQLRFITPRTPRALYFNEDIYVGYIPGGKIEIVSIDPELGGIFYIFDLPQGSAPVVVERSDRCMNCHASRSTGGIPGISLKSVLPGVSGGSIDSFRRDQIGHQVAYEERFGGWFVTGDQKFGTHWGNKTGNYNGGELVTTGLVPGRVFDFSNYLVESSNVLPQLILEHQAGFTNRMTESIYLTREWLSEGRGRIPSERKEALREQARRIARYVFFADEPRLPGPIEGAEDYARDFVKAGRKDAQGRSLRDLDLKTRLFRYRCSYMIETAMFQEMPEVLREEVFAVFREALKETGGDPEFAYLTVPEKRAIREIVSATRG